MFNNLIESSSHAKEFKRRGSFLLFTTATYVVLFRLPVSLVSTPTTRISKAKALNWNSSACVPVIRNRNPRRRVPRVRFDRPVSRPDSDPVNAHEN